MQGSVFYMVKLTISVSSIPAVCVCEGERECEFSMAKWNCILESVSFCSFNMGSNILAFQILNLLNVHTDAFV
jgi:hypothetical protein